MNSPRYKEAATRGKSIKHHVRACSPRGRVRQDKVLYLGYISAISRQDKVLFVSVHRHRDGVFPGSGEPPSLSLLLL